VNNKKRRNKSSKCCSSNIYNFFRIWFLCKLYL